MSHCLWMTAIVVLLSIAAPAIAQDKPADEPAKSEATETPKEATPELTPAEAFVKMIQEGDLDEAIAAITSAVEANPDDKTLPNFRMRLAGRLMAATRITDAIPQLEAARAWMLRHMDEAESRTLVASTTVQLRSLYSRSGMSDKAAPMVEESLAVLREHVDDGKPDSGLGALASLITLKAQILAIDDNDAAAQLLAADCEAFAVRAKESADVEPLLGWVSLMQTRVSLVGRTDSEAATALSAELEGVVTEAVAKQPESVELTSAWLRMRLSGISRIMRDDPDTAQQMFDQTTAALEQSPLKDDAAISRMAGQLKSLTRSIAAAKLVKEMIGKPAPAFDIQAWAHGDELSADALQGKVVMLDFWAIWCGPCVATFPHLKEWHHEFHDKGFEIVGVTRRYGYDWDEDTSKALRSRKVDDVTLETEVMALGKFMDSHELTHPTIVVPENSEMNTNYGVTGIPHAVLIDRKGNVRMVKVGSGEANASALRAMIEELLAEE